MKLCSRSVLDDVTLQISCLNLEFTFHLSASISHMTVYETCFCKCVKILRTHAIVSFFLLTFFVNREPQRTKERKRKFEHKKEITRSRYQKKPVSSQWQKTELND